MARSDLLLNLVKAGSVGDRPMFQKTVDAIVAEERAKRHNVLADQLERAVKTLKMNGSQSAPHPANEPMLRARDYVYEISPKRTLGELVLPDLTRQSTAQLIEEQQRADVLRSHSLEPRNRVLLVGPPGNGKTTLAEAIAEGLSVPLYVVRYESVIGSFLGETATRLKRIFDYVRTIPCVLFFDEFDTVGKERGDKHETGEIKRVVSSLLMQVDDLPSYVVVVAATNHAELLDRAVWRRFQLRLSLPLPSAKQLATFVDALSERTGIRLGMSSQQVVKSLGQVSYSEAEDFFLDVARRQVLALGERSPESVVREQLKLWTARVKDRSAIGPERRSARPSSS